MAFKGLASASVQDRIGGWYLEKFCEGFCIKIYFVINRYIIVAEDLPFIEKQPPHVIKSVGILLTEVNNAVQNSLSIVDVQEVE